MAATFDALGIPYVLGGSVASSLIGEPRSTADLDVAVRIRAHDLDALLAAVAEDFYVSPEHAHDALRDEGAFNLIAWRSADKVDVFVLGEGLLDRRQIERRQCVEVAGVSIWVTSVEDQVLRKLTWFQMTGETSERQWRDVVGILTVQAGRLDEDDLTRTADALGSPSSSNWRAPTPLRRAERRFPPSPAAGLHRLTRPVRPSRSRERDGGV